MAFAVLRTSKLLQMMRCAQRSSVVCNVLVVALVFVLLLLVGQCDCRASKYPLMHGQIFQTWGVIEPVVYDGVNDLKGLRPHRSFGPTLGPLWVRSPVPRKMDASACLVR